MNVLTLAVAALLGAGSTSTSTSTATATPPTSTAAPAPFGPATLLVIDVQNFYFPGGTLPLTGPLEASLKARALLDAFRARGWPVVHVLHLGKGQAAPSPDSGEEGYRAHPNVRPLPGEVVIGKREANAFRDTELLATLRSLGTTRLVIAGMQTQMCVEAATRAAADLGFQVTVVHDACASRPLTFGGLEVPAPQVHAAALAAMASAYATVTSTEALLARLPPATP
ncbi:MAG: cysteine hydrolase [Anaeromyxobacter sp.]|nr:cysteine hydrolase [Anaeromyxobacter sp.]